MRGGHIKSGPVGFDEPKRALRGTRTRARHRSKGLAGAAMVVCEGPPHLTADEQQLWNYYAPLLAAADRLTLESRDVLGKYCTSLATVQRLKRQMAGKRYRDVVSKGSRPNPLL